MKRALLVVAFLACAFGSGPRGATASAPGQADATSKIKHLVVLLQENHTFDNYFGTFPGADGTPAGTCIPENPDVAGSACIAPFHIGDTDVTLGDLDHSAAAAKLQYNGGRMDGFVSALTRRGQDGRLAMGYYDERDLPYYWHLAREYVLFDRFFSSANDGSFKNHVYAVAASSLNPGKPGADAGPRRTVANDQPTIFDELEARGVSWKVYVQNYDPNLTYRTVDQYSGDRASQVVWVPLLNIDRFIDDPRLSSHIVDLSEYYDDLNNGTLPAVSYIAPSGASEHPPGSVASGERAVRTLITALQRSSAWPESAFLLTYDDWGGWYDHVSPPQVDEDGYGFRVPALLVSAYARTGVVDHTQLDFTSILRFIEDNYNLPPLSSRDAEAQSLAPAFDFEQAPRPPQLWSDGSIASPATSSRRGVVYAAYGGLLALAGVALAAMAVRSRRGHGGDGGPAKRQWETR